jgi:hypothetical protein
MFGRVRLAPAFGVACVALGLLGCTGEIQSDDPSSPDDATGGSTVNPPRGGSGPGPVGGSGSGGTPTLPNAGSSAGGSANTTGGRAASGGVAGAPDPEQTLIPARIRRLANAEYDTSVQVLFEDAALSPASDYDFPPDARQAGFTLNDAQRVDPIVAKQFAAAAAALAETAKARAATLAPCSDPNPGESCARSFIEKFGAKVYRRPLSADEIDGPAPNDGLLDLYRAGAEGATYADGIELVVRGLLQSAGFLYLTELGAGTGPSSAGTRVELTPHELSAALSYLATGGPANEQLISAAVAGGLATPKQRGDELVKLIGSGQNARRRMIRLMQEWLGIDRMSATSKDSNVYAAFDAVKAPLLRESEEFIGEVLYAASGNVSELLGAEYTYSSGPLEAPLQALYLVNGQQGRIPFNRRGLLNQGAFLSVFAHAHESGPVLRGVVVARRVACIPIQSPTELNIVVVPPVPDPAKTTRERFAIHSQDAKCRGCHDKIDPFGFAFELYDGMGQYRTQEIPVGQTTGPTVDSHVVLAAGTPIDGEYADSNALALALSESPAVRECFARHLFRGSIGRSDPAVTAAENEFVRYWQTAWDALDPAQRADANAQGNFERILRALVENPLFTQRIVN